MLELPSKLFPNLCAGNYLGILCQSKIDSMLSFEEPSLSLDPNPKAEMALFLNTFFGEHENLFSPP